MTTYQFYFLIMVLAVFFGFIVMPALGPPAGSASPPSWPSATART